MRNTSIKEFWILSLVRFLLPLFLSCPPLTLSLLSSSTRTRTSTLNYHLGSPSRLFLLPLNSLLASLVARTLIPRDSYVASLAPLHHNTKDRMFANGTNAWTSTTDTTYTVVSLFFFSSLSLFFHFCHWLSWVGWNVVLTWLM